MSALRIKRGKTRREFAEENARLRAENVRFRDAFSKLQAAARAASVRETSNPTEGEEEHKG